MEKIVAATTIEKLTIDGTHFSEINIRSENIQDIIMVASVQGETFENVLLTTNLEDGGFSIAAGYTPFFKAHDDKLAAHKVLSLALDIYIPEHLDVDVSAMLSNLSLAGAFGFVHAQLTTGNCMLDDFKGAGTIVSKTGNVFGTVNQEVLIVQMLEKQNPNILVTQSLPYLLRIAAKGGTVSITQTE